MLEEENFELNKDIALWIYACVYKEWKQWQNLFWGGSKLLQMVTAAMKLKDAYSLEGKLWPT